MITIKLTMPNSSVLGLYQVQSVTEIPSTIEAIEANLHQMLSEQQKAYQNKYQVADEDIVADFNGDRLWMAMALRMKDAKDMVDELGHDESFYIALDEGYIKPSKEHLERIAEHLRFPITHFTREDKVDRGHRHTFICYNDEG